MGVYALRGTLADGGVIVDVGDTEDVILVLDGVETDEPNATLCSAADLTLAGEGELVLEGNHDDGIRGMDDAVVAGDDGVHGDRLVTIDGGSTTITDAFEGIESQVLVVNDGWIDTADVRVHS